MALSRARQSASLCRPIWEMGPSPARAVVVVGGDTGQLYERLCPWLSCLQEVGRSSSVNPAMLCQETPLSHLLNEETKKLTRSLLLYHSTSRSPT